MSSQYHTKKTGSILDYGVDWSLWLDGDEIASHEWIVPVGIVKEAEDYNATLATIELSGGTPGEIYTIKSKIVTVTKGLEECAPIYMKINVLVC